MLKADARSYTVSDVVRVPFSLKNLSILVFSPSRTQALPNWSGAKSTGANEPEVTAMPDGSQYVILSTA